MNPQRHLEFHERQAAAMQRLTDLLLHLIPQHWRQAQLELDVLYSPLTKARVIRHCLTNPATGESVCDFPPELFEASTALHVVFTGYDQAWIRAVIELTFQGNGTFRQRKANFIYGP